MPAYSYDERFIEYTAQSSSVSARRVTSLLHPVLAPESVMDVGCAKGTWLRAWADQGVRRIHGLDGPYVDRAQLEIPEASFTAADLNQPFAVGSKFDLVQSLEVAEHIERAASSRFIDSITGHAERFVLFSAAPPGQGGEHHINERSYEFWRREFIRCGFAVLDAVRPAIMGDTSVSYWYRYNTFLYVRHELLPTLDVALRAKVVPDGEPLRDVAPVAFRMRKAIVRKLPYAVQHNIARMKAKFAPTGRF